MSTVAKEWRKCCAGIGIQQISDSLVQNISHAKTADQSSMQKQKVLPPKSERLPIHPPYDTRMRYSGCLLNQRICANSARPQSPPAWNQRPPCHGVRVNRLHSSACLCPSMCLQYCRRSKIAALKASSSGQLRPVGSQRIHKDDLGGSGR